MEFCLLSVTFARFMKRRNGSTSIPFQGSEVVRCRLTKGLEVYINENEKNEPHESR
jgi:hypothetical protein